ncbi:serine hydrolase domain-containing protein [Halioglobus maricola]|nr:serine hydrolase domain-containing protein [Halioglobus maricola]
MATVLESLEQESGFSGVVFLQLDGSVIHEAAYGSAGTATGGPIQLDTIFGIGSRPIDFTSAAIYRLAHLGELKLDDYITDYFEDVPDDKLDVTLRHLMTGRSGLPDFHGLPTDPDQDLTWIDRYSAERRILSQQLLFAPGEGEAHSHSAFGLLASVIERVSGETYLEFLTNHFFAPAGMTRSGEYGSWGGHDRADFALGGGPSVVGEPNIPPNWGKTSWLIKGSGGMYSTLGDLRKFYAFIRASDVLGPEYTQAFNAPSVNMDGSERGFELFSARDEDGSDQMFLLVNMESQSNLFVNVGEALADIVMKN